MLEKRLRIEFVDGHRLVTQSQAEISFSVRLNGNLFIYMHLYFGLRSSRYNFMDNIMMRLVPLGGFVRIFGFHGTLNGKGNFATQDHGSGRHCGIVFIFVNGQGFVGFGRRWQKSIALELADDGSRTDGSNSGIVSL